MIETEIKTYLAQGRYKAAFGGLSKLKNDLGQDDQQIAIHLMARYKQNEGYRMTGRKTLSECDQCMEVLRCDLLDFLAGLEDHPVTLNIPALPIRAEPPSSPKQNSKPKPRQKETVLVPESKRGPKMILVALLVVLLGIIFSEELEGVWDELNLTTTETVEPRRPTCGTVVNGQTGNGSIVEGVDKVGKFLRGTSKPEKDENQGSNPR